MKVRADAKGLPLTLEVRGDVPETITTDPIRLRQILVNLVGNSIKFTEVGGVRVVMRLALASETEDTLIFDVIDTGIGMSEEQMGLLFRPFSQVDGSASRRFRRNRPGLGDQQTVGRDARWRYCRSEQPRPRQHVQPQYRYRQPGWAGLGPGTERVNRRQRGAGRRPPRSSTAASSWPRMAPTISD